MIDGWSEKRGFMEWETIMYGVGTRLGIANYVIDESRAAYALRSEPTYTYVARKRWPR
jgi:hypothetical protein